MVKPSTMAEESAANLRLWIDPKSGYCSHTKTFHSLRPPVPLPPLSQPLSLTQFTLSLLQSSTAKPTTSVLIDAASGRHVSYQTFLSQIHSLTLSLQSLALSKGHVAFILSPTSLHVPVLYFSLLALGVVVSPANPIGSESEIAHQVRLTQPAIAFATSATANKLPKGDDKIRSIILLDSPEFLSMLDRDGSSVTQSDTSVEVNQTDPAAILFSSGTTGRVKGVMLTHCNFIALIAGIHAFRREPDPTLPDGQGVLLFTLPLFHVFGFCMVVGAVATGETLVLMERFEFEAMLRAVERHKISYMPVSPPLIVALAKSELAQKYDLSSLRFLGCGGAPLSKEVVDRFCERFPSMEIGQGYALTETGGGGTRMIDSEECSRRASVGRLAENMEAKIADPETGEALPPGKSGELWLRGPTIMKGYVGDDKATAEILDEDGWLKTGDLCYFDDEGFLYIVDRLKELIKYKAYQVPPAELEHILQSHPDVVDAAVIPYPDENAGQIPMAYVVRKPGSNITEAQVMDFVAKQVAPYKKIRRVAFINSIQKSPSGKILRRELVTHALATGSSKL
ncbi:4-coumarate--CoA ligase-like 9 isoform X1 [Pyrus x bretschneideri]|uniref:4-coumarate--CoA ligase-like 9 isoform X1 n=1 Tax=Pyrus x bretschneideri TaxID=225117 RepID=UPI00202F0D63|nr:4-coumarate--CoA ligase-like 9 isoform X1 [Pyrus x bretschneideri]